MWARWATTGLGAWLLVAPHALDYGEPVARTNGLIVGFAAIIFAMISFAVRETRLVTAALGLWLIAAPFVLRYQETHTMISDVAVGVLMVGFSAIATRGPGAGRPRNPTP